MLLRRVINDLNNQNWTAVALDFFIVVFGVFIGIQVDSWNQARIDRDDERGQLELLVRDLQNDTGLMDSLADSISHHVPAARLIVSAAEGETISTSEIEQAFTVLYLTLNYSPPASAYTGLRNGGNLDQLSNAGLRARIVDYFEVEQIRFRDEYVADYRTAQANLRSQFWQYVRLRIHDDVEITTPIPEGLDWTTLLSPVTDVADDVRFLNDLSEITGRGTEVLLVLEELRQENQELQNAIEAYLI